MVRTGRPPIGPRIQINVPAGLLADIDEEAARRGTTRAEEIRRRCEALARPEPERPVTDTPSAPALTDQGWAFTTISRRAHYYDADGLSLCRQFGSFGVPAEAFEHETGRPTPDDCASCRRRIDKRGPK